MVDSSLAIADGNGKLSNPKYGYSTGYNPGDIICTLIGGLSIVSCDTSKARFLSSGLDTLRLSNSGSHQGLNLSEASLRVLKEFFGDISEWHEKKPGLIVKGSIKLDTAGSIPDPELSVNLEENNI